MTGIEVDSNNILRIEAHDVSDIFDHIKEITASGQDGAIFAPFGPKTMSLAMCLFARLTQGVVYYSQPRLYHPNYSIGIRAVEAYCLRLNGRDYYTL